MERLETSMNPVTNFKAQALSAALNMVLGYQPVITETPQGKAVLYFKPEDLPKIRSALQAMALKAGKAGQGDVSVALAPVVAPLALKYVAPVVAGLVGAGLLAGYLIGHR
jgi:hypothetical protein